MTNITTTIRYYQKWKQVASWPTVKVQKYFKNLLHLRTNLNNKGSQFFGKTCYSPDLQQWRLNTTQGNLN